MLSKEEIKNVLAAAGINESTEDPGAKRIRVMLYLEFIPDEHTGGLLGVFGKHIERAANDFGADLCEYDLTIGRLKVGDGLHERIHFIKTFCVMDNPWYSDKAENKAA